MSKAAIIVLDEKDLLELLDFEGGKIHNIRRPVDEWNPGTFEILLEHPDLDEVEDGFVLRRIIIVYHCGMRGSYRVEPPKRRVK